MTILYFTSRIRLSSPRLPQVSGLG